jgi:hypothetical protein
VLTQIHREPHVKKTRGKNYPNAPGSTYPKVRVNTCRKNAKKNLPKCTGKYLPKITGNNLLETHGEKLPKCARKVLTQKHREPIVKKTEKNTQIHDELLTQKHREPLFHKKKTRKNYPNTPGTTYPKAQRTTVPATQCIVPSSSYTLQMCDVISTLMFTYNYMDSGFKFIIIIIIIC